MDAERIVRPVRGPVAWSALIAFLLASSITPVSGFGQIFAQAEGDEAQEEEDFGRTVFLPADRAVLQRLNKAEELISQERFGEAVRYLGYLLESSEDYFYQPDPSEPVHRSLKSQAHHLIGQMPRQGRELYELQYGARARQMLDEAAAEANVTRLAEVSRRFFHTEAGYEATLLMGIYHLDHGCPLAGALALERLAELGSRVEHLEPALSLTLASCWMRSEMPERAAETLRRLVDGRPGAAIEAGGRELALPTDEQDVLAWLEALVGEGSARYARTPDQWVMTRGNPQRNAESSGGAPLLSVRWRVPNADHPLLEGDLGYRARVYREQNVPALPVIHPLAVGRTVLMRSAKTLLAVDFESGKRLWEVPTDGDMEDLVLSEGDLGRQYDQLDRGLRQRIWEDATYGKLSSDGRLVFSIEDLGVSTGARNVRHVIINARRVQQPDGPRPYNRLAAHDIQTGKLIWHVGGGSDDYDLPLAGTFFLGPPLPLMQQLYILAEVKGEIRLLALRAETGELLWSQQLAVVEQSILQDPLRRMSGIAPSYADGVLVCPTSNGAVVAVQLATRSLLWGYQYASSESSHHRRIIAARVRGYQNPDAAARWEDSTVVLADGKVLATPVDSDELHCLNLIDGRLLWKQPRGTDLYLACVHRQHVVLVGQDSFRAIRLTDGEPAWDGRQPELPEGAVPAGRGFRSGNYYYLPLSTAEVATIDLEKGEIVARARSRSGHVPGNLVCYRGRVLSHGTEALESYDQVDSLKTAVDQALAKDPDDAAALIRRGEILLDEGRRAGAIASLRKAYEIAPDPRTRRLLRSALLDGLREDFAAYRDEAQEIEHLLDDASEQATYLRLMATGLQQVGQLRKSLEHYLKLVDLQGDVRRLEPVDRWYSVRWDQRIQAQLAGLRQAAPPEVQAELDAMIKTQLDKALSDGSVASLQRFLAYFGSHPVGQAAREHLIARLVERDRLLEAELLLSRQARAAGTAEARGASMAALGEMLSEAGRYEDAAVCYRQLADRFADVACKGELTGRELVERVGADSAVREHLGPEASWPIGHVKIEKESVKRSRPPSFGNFGMQFEGSQAPFFTDKSVEFNQNQRQVSAYDGHGNRLWKVSLLEEGQDRSFPFNRNLNRAAVRGHLMLVSMGYKVFAIDTLTEGAPKVIWVQDLTEPIGIDDDLAGPHQELLNRMRAQNPRLNLLRHYGFPPNAIGAVNDRYVCCWRFHACVAVDPLTGDVLWLRKDVPLGSRVVGDEQYAVVLPNEQQEDRDVMVLRAADGKLVATRPPVTGELLGNIDRRVLLWKAVPEARELELWDAAEDVSAWNSPKFAAAAVARVVDDELIAVYEPEGKLSLLSTADGKVLVEAGGLPVESALTDVHVFPYRGYYAVVTSSQSRGARRPTQAMPGTLYEPIVAGHVAVIDENGTLMGKPVKIENQHLVLNQPNRLPVLIFACQIYERQPNGSGRHTASVLGIDKRTGRVICREQFPKPTNTFAIEGDPETSQVRIVMKDHELSLQFTSDPAPPDAEPVEEDKPQTATRALFKALRRAAGRMVENPLENLPTDGLEDRLPQLPQAIEGKKPKAKPAEDDGAQRKQPEAKQVGNQQPGNQPMQQPAVKVQVIQQGGTRIEIRQHQFRPQQPVLPPQAQEPIEKQAESPPAEEERAAAEE